MRRLCLWAGAVLMASALNGCGDDAEVTEEAIRPVRYERVFATGGTRIRTFSGTAQAGQESQLSFKVAGNVERLVVKVGDRVARGDEIAHLDDSDYLLRVQEAEAALTQAQAELRNAESGYERVQVLWENATASKQDLDAARAAFESAEARVLSIEKRRELAGLQAEYTTLRAPFDGAVAEVLGEQNENVQAGQAIAVLTSDDRPEVKVAVPEVIIAQIRPGSPATISFAALGLTEVPATVTEVGVASTGFATTFPVTVSLDEAVPQVRPGMAAEVAFRFETESAREAVIVPAVAVGEDHHGRFVFVVEPGQEDQGIARRTAVTVGELTTEGLEILGGLQEGDLVVTAGVSRLTDGQRVKLL